MSVEAKPCEICGAPARGGVQRFCSQEHWRQWLRENAEASATAAVLRKRAYDRWLRMMQRCEDPSNPRWARYGGRGIYVCERWHNFDLYYADTGDAPSGRTLDRIDNDGPYEPGNFRWATPKEQRANQEYDHMRRRTHCKRGHPFDEANTRVNKRGWRICRACSRAKRARQQAAKRAARVTCPTCNGAGFLDTSRSSATEPA